MGICLVFAQENASDVYKPSLVESLAAHAIFSQKCLLTSSCFQCGPDIDIDATVDLVPVPCLG